MKSSGQQKDASGEKPTPQTESGVPTTRRILVLLDPPERGWILLSVTEASEPA